MKKGFTLIELLAVIVILAIIALIATPIVLNIINDARESSTILSVEFYLDALERDIVLSFATNNDISDGTYSITAEGNLCSGVLINNECNQDIIEVDVSKNNINGGDIIIQNGKIVFAQIEQNDKFIIKDEFGEFTSLVNFKKNQSGMYDDKNNLIYTWDELLESGIIKVTETGVLSKVDQNLLEGTLIIADGVTEIKNLWGCDNLRNVILPDSVTSIGNSAFSGNSNLEYIVFSNNLESIGSSSFKNCSNLKYIVIPNSVTSIGEKAFFGCINLKQAILSNVIDTIPDNLFYECSNLKSIKIPKGVKSIGIYAFYGVEALTSVTIPSSVTSIGEGAFRATGLTSVVVPDSVTEMGKSVFRACKSLKSVVLSNKISTIENSSFRECENLNNLAIPESVTSIGEEAFWGTNFTTIIIPSTVTTINKLAFYQCQNLTTIYYSGISEGSPWGAPSSTNIIN